MSILDTRDLQERFDELEQERESLVEAIEEAQEALADAEEHADTDELHAAIQAASGALEEWDTSDEAEELKELQIMAEEVPEWRYGEALIPVDEFEEYCQELLEDIGVLPKDMPGYIVIDWEATANNISQGYSIVTYQGTDYYYRS